MTKENFEGFAEQELREIQIDHTSVFDGVLLHVKKDTVRLPNGKTTGREYIRHPGAVCIVPITEDGKVIIERQYRYPYDAVLTELPAGKLDKGEDPEKAARRELFEETGTTADELVYMGKFYPACAYTDEIIHMYLAKGLSFGERKLDDDEFLNVEAVPFGELLKDVIDGKIPDGKTQTAVMRAYWAMQEKGL